MLHNSRRSIYDHQPYRVDAFRFLLFIGPSVGVTGVQRRRWPRRATFVATSWSGQKDIEPGNSSVRRSAELPRHPAAADGGAQTFKNIYIDPAPYRST